MDSKCVLIAFVIACGRELVHSHILPPAHIDYPIAECMRALTRHMVNLCSTYGDYADVFTYGGMPLIRRDISSIRLWEMKQRIIKNCCSRPCSSTELYAIC